MIEYKNIQRYDNLDFDKYLSYKGYGHSSIKTLKKSGGVIEDFTPSEIMRVGSMVDSILTEPERVKINRYYEIASPIAKFISRECPYLMQCEKQVSYTAQMGFKGFVLPTKGRLDYQLGKHMVIDLKITKSSKVRDVIKFMGYENQLWHYKRLAGAQETLILIYSVPKKTCELIYIDTSGPSFFWEDAIMNFGTVKENIILNDC